MKRPAHAMKTTMMAAASFLLEASAAPKTKSMYVGPGAARQRKRLEAKAKANESIPVIDKAPSRQVVRAAIRRIAKSRQLTKAGLDRVSTKTRRKTCNLADPTMRNQVSADILEREMKNRENRMAWPADNETAAAALLA